MKWNLLPALAFSASLILPSATAQAAAGAVKAYSDLGARNGFGVACTPAFGPAEKEGVGHKSVWVAGQFKATATGPLDHIDIPVATYSGQNGVIVSLVADKAGVPDTADPELETFFSNKLKPASPVKLAKFVSKLHPDIVANTLYWVVVQAYGMDNFSCWNFNSVKSPDPFSFSQDGGVTWSNGTPAVAFDVWVELVL